MTCRAGVAFDCECALFRYVPLGLKKWFHRCKITNVKELDWWQSVQHCGGPVTVTMTPAQVTPTYPSKQIAAAVCKRGAVYMIEKFTAC